MANFEVFTPHLELKEKVLEKMTILLVKFKKNTGKALKLEWGLHETITTSRGQCGW